MRKIERFQITGMTISGFKSYREPAEFTFGDPTVITGGNGQGKSSIADAIAFAVTGLPFFGERGIDRLHNEESPELFISLRFVDGDGAPHELTRTRQRDRMTITYDGYMVRQTDLWEMFGERDVFLSILNPLYFIEELGDSGKNLLERYLPAVSHERVLEQLSPELQLALKNEEILSPDVYLKNLRAEIRELEEQIIYWNGQKDLAATQGQEHDRAKGELERRIADLDAEIKSLEARQYDGIDTKELEDRLVELSNRYSEALQDGRAEAVQAQEKLRALREKIDRRREDQYQSPYAEMTAVLKAAVTELAKRYNEEVTTYRSFAPGMVCPTCRRPVTDETLPEVQSCLKKGIAEILTAGKEQRAKLQELKELDQKSAGTFEQFKADDLSKWEAEAAELEKECAEAKEAGQAEQIQAEMQALTAELEYGRLKITEYDRLRECREELTRCKAEQSALQSMASQAAPDFDARIGEAQERIGTLKRKIASAVVYLSKRAELTFAPLKMNRVEISLYDVVKTTGELKDVFKFTYNGRRYDRLSLSEKIRAGMEVSELMKRLTGRRYPVFVDNMESVDDLNNVRSTGQIILAKCVSKTPLQVRPVRPIQAAEQKAA